MKTVMLHMKLPDDLAEACEGKDLKAEVSAALRDRWFHSVGSVKEFVDSRMEIATKHLDAEIIAERYPTYGSIPAEQKRV